MKKGTKAKWVEEYKVYREVLKPYLKVSKAFPRSSNPTYADVRRARRYIDRLGPLLAQPQGILVTRSPKLRAEILREYPDQPRIPHMRGPLVPTQSAGDRVTARRGNQGVELVYESESGALARRQVRIPSRVIAAADTAAAADIIKRAFAEAESDGYTVAFLSLDNAYESSISSLVGESTGVDRMVSKAVEIMTNKEKYQEPEKWFRGVSFLKDTGRKRVKSRAGSKRRRKQPSAAESARKRRLAIARSI